MGNVASCTYIASAYASTFRAPLIKKIEGGTVRSARRARGEIFAYAPRKSRAEFESSFGISETPGNTELRAENAPNSAL